MAILLNGFNLLFITLLRGGLFILCWNWFVQEVFRVPDVSLPEALGLSLFVSFLVYQFSTTPLDEFDDATDRALATLVVTLVMYAFWFGMAVIIKLFM